MKKNNLAAFLADESDVRKYLRSPLKIMRGVAYTNGHMAVIALDENSAEPASEYLENILNDIVVDCESANTNWLPCPDVDPVFCRCTNCNGTGKVDACNECGGLGCVEFENDCNSYEVDCKSCDDQAGLICEYCSGLGYGGRKSKHPEVLLNGVAVNPAYVKKIFDNLDNPVLSPRYAANKVLIKFDGGVGALMSMREHKEDAPELLKELI